MPRKECKAIAEKESFQKSRNSLGIYSVVCYVNKKVNLILNSPFDINVRFKSF